MLAVMCRCETLFSRDAFHLQVVRCRTFTINTLCFFPFYRYSRLCCCLKKKQKCLSSWDLPAWAIQLSSFCSNAMLWSFQCIHGEWVKDHLICLQVQLKWLKKVIECPILWWEARILDKVFRWLGKATRFTAAHPLNRKDEAGLKRKEKGDQLLWDFYVGLPATTNCY